MTRTEGHDGETIRERVQREAMETFRRAPVRIHVMLADRMQRLSEHMLQASELVRQTDPSAFDCFDTDDMITLSDLATGLALVKAFHQELDEQNN